MLIIADIAGQFDALKRLVDRVPPDEKIILVGDLVDRGHDSFEVVEWAMKNRDRTTTLMGNHEHMMLEYYRPTKGYRGVYGPDCWKWNGGANTMASYTRHGHKRPPENHLDWLASLPSVFISVGLFVSHAPLHQKFDVDNLPTHDDPLNPEFDVSLLWNRTEPKERNFMQVFGHNSHWGFREFKNWEDGKWKTWAVCIDQSQSGILTGLQWPSMEVFKEPYLNAPSGQFVPGGRLLENE